jgi:hypothetical protein
MGSLEVVETPLGPHPRRKQNSRARAYSVRVSFRGPVEAAAEETCVAGLEGAAAAPPRSETRGDVTFVEVGDAKSSRWVTRRALAG